MIQPSRTLTVSIDCSPKKTYQFVADPQNLPLWATAFIRSVETTAQGWVAHTTEGAVGFEFVASNEQGVLDHWVRVAPGVTFLNPMRVVANGDGSEVMFTLFQSPGMTDAKFAEDAGMVARDLATLKSVLER